MGFSSKLQTLMLSSNYFGCDVAALDNAESLAIGNKLVLACDLWLRFSLDQRNLSHLVVIKQVISLNQLMLL